MNDIFVLGFDPTFLDIIVAPLDKNKQKLTDFPQIGDHIPNTDVKMVAGGNSLNLARTLTKLTSFVYFFGSFNTSFYELIQKDDPAIHCKSTTTTEPNVTVALQFASGEVQMNSLKTYFRITDLTFESLMFLTCSKIVPFSNIGLNKEGPALFDFLASYFIDLNQLSDYPDDSDTSVHLNYLSIFLSKYESISSIEQFFVPDIQEIENLNLPFNQIQLPRKIFYFDPSTVKYFSNWSWLQSFFKSKFGYLPGYKIITLNEYEFEIMKHNDIDFNFFLQLNNEKNFLVVHESTKVTYFQGSLIAGATITVPSIDETQIISSVGSFKKLR